MPYESFKRSHQLSIRGLVQDRQTGSWRYLIRVKRVMQDDASAHVSWTNNSDEATAAEAATTPSAARALWRRRRSSSFTPASPTSSSAFGAGNAYDIRRSYSEFKLLHAAVKPIMARDGGALPSLPQDSVFAFFVGETQTMLQKKRLALENLLIAIENHGAASDSSEYLEFLARTDTYDQVSKALASPPPLSSHGFQASHKECVSKRNHSDNMQRQDGGGGGGRWRSAEAAGSANAATHETNESAPAVKENRVDFHRYSLM
ncbi:hypothetical protein PybrP1_000287 [[Pythium] brassicae (nom. inval.)]|nr:hypothetical protein PybrP1_000287 [[Pythium] brassicae (nom. inval.)]